MNYRCKKCGGRTMQSGGSYYDKTGLRGIRFPRQPIMEDMNIPYTPSFTPPDEAMQYQLPENRVHQGIKQGIIEGPYGEDPMDYYTAMNQSPQMRNNTTPQNTLQNIGIGLQGLTTGLGWLSNTIDRKRQNQYDYEQQSALGQMNPMPTESFQPNPYSLYAKYGGSLRNYMKYGGLQHATYFGPPFSNGAKMDFTNGEKLDKVFIRKRVFPALFKKFLEGGTI